MDASGLKIPNHVGIIMDGNGRWAKSRGLPRVAGHREGAKTLEKVMRALKDYGVRILTVYAFSTENWKRPKEEVDYLMGLFEEYLRDRRDEFIEQGTRFNVLGDKSRLAPGLRSAIDSLEEATRDFAGFAFNMALNYGGRAEMVVAVREIAADLKAGRIQEDDITEDLVSARLYTGGQPDPDLIIRTSGEQRLSGFMLWQCSYSELYFPQVHFPSFGEKEIRMAIEEYSRRDRRYGKV